MINPRRTISSAMTTQKRATSVVSLSLFLGRIDSAAMWPRAFVIAVSFGAVYGLLALEAASPLAIVLLVWVIAILILAWRLPLKATALAASVGGFITGFGVLWAVVLGAQLATCRPPACATADPATDVLYALAFLVPVIALEGSEIGLRTWLSRHR